MRDCASLKGNVYNNYFGFSKSPFEDNLDQRFLFFSEKHKEVATALLYFIEWKKGFALVCGDAGTGKTMLVNYLLSRLPDSAHPILIANCDADYSVILRYIAGVLKIDAKGINTLDLVDQVKAALVDTTRADERFVLIIDEAHLLSCKCIDQIRLLSNIESHDHNLIQILFLGQNELISMLGRPEMRQLRQRININRFLAPMDASETIQYIDHRLRMAGASFDACFEPECRRLIFKMTKGVPRSINQLCDGALLACMTEKRLKVDRKILKNVVVDQRNNVLFTPGSHAGNTNSAWKSSRLIAAFGVSAIFWILFGIYAYRGGMGAGIQNILFSFYSSGNVPVSALNKTSDNLEGNAIPMPSEALLSEEKQLVLSGEERDLEKESATYSSEIEMQSSGGLVPENRDPAGASAADSPKMQQAQRTGAPEPPRENAGNAEISPQLPVNVIQLKKLASVSRNSKRVEVRKGDTLFGIASRFFPGNKADGVKKILAANPMVNDTHRIYPGQKLVIPQAGL